MNSPQIKEKRKWSLRTGSNGKDIPDTDLVWPKYLSQPGPCGDKALFLFLAVIHQLRWIHEREALQYITPPPPPPMCSMWASQSHTRLFVMRLCILISNSVLRATGQADTYEIFPLLTLATASAGEINPLSADSGSRLHQHTLKTNINATVCIRLFEFCWDCVEPTEDIK